MSNFTDIFVSGLARVQQQVSAQFFSFGGPPPEPNFTPNEAPGFYNVFADPTVGPGYPAPEGSLAILSVSPFGVYQKTGVGPTDWTLLSSSGGSGPVAPTTLTLQSPITPAAIAGTVNNYAPAGGNATAWWRLLSSATALITGIAAQPVGTLLFVDNIGGTHSISFSNEAGGSTAANRITTPSGETWTLPAGGGIVLVYDVSDRWRFFSIATNVQPDTTVIGNLTQSGGDISFTASTVVDMSAAGGGVSIVGGDVIVVGGDLQVPDATLLDGAALAVSPANEARLRYNNSTGFLEVSLNGGAYVTVVTL